MSNNRLEFGILPRFIWIIFTTWQDSFLSGQFTVLGLKYILSFDLIWLGPQHNSQGMWFPKHSRLAPGVMITILLQNQANVV